MFGRSGKRPEMLRTSQGTQMDLEQIGGSEDTTPGSPAQYPSLSTFCDILITDNVTRQLHSQLTTSPPVFVDTRACVVLNPGLSSSDPCSFFVSVSLCQQLFRFPCVHSRMSLALVTDAPTLAWAQVSERMKSVSLHHRMSIPPSVHRSWLTVITLHGSEQSGS